MGTRFQAGLLSAGALALTLGCTRAAAPPTWAGASLGTPNKGSLLSATELPRQGEGIRWLRGDDHHFGLPRFVFALERAAATVARERPGGAPLAVGDISARSGGHLRPHLSHQSGRDADLLLYLTTLEGAPVDSPGFAHVQADGLAWDGANQRFLRFDVEREWLLVKALLEDPEARVQWIFASEVLEAILVEWARARGDSAEIILRAQTVMLQPNPGGVHDDHIHVRTDCSPDDVLRGCESIGPVRPWLYAAPPRDSDDELVAALLKPIEAPAAVSQRQ